MPKLIYHSAIGWFDPTQVMAVYVEASTNPFQPYHPGQPEPTGYGIALAMGPNGSKFSTIHNLSREDAQSSRDAIAEMVNRRVSCSA